MADGEEERLTALEIRAAEQERTIEELSAQVAAQWEEIDRLKKKLEMLAERFLTLEEQSIPAAEAQRPPHW